MKRHVVLIFIVFAALLAATPSLAVQFQVTPRLSVTGEYTDNLFLTEVDTKDDYITSISPGITIGMNGRTVGFNLAYDPAYTMFKEYSEFDDWRHNVVFTSFADLTASTRLTVNDTYIYTNEPLSLDDFTLRRSRQNFSRNILAVNLVQQFGEMDSFRLGYARNSLSNEDRTIEDSKLQTPSAGITYWFTSRLGIDLSGSYSTIDYWHKADPTPADEFDQWTGAASLLWRFDARTQGYVRYTYTNVEYEGLTPDYRLYNPSVGVTYEAGQNATLTVDIGYYTVDRDTPEDDSGMSLNASYLQTFRNASVNLTGARGYTVATGAENLGSTSFYQAGAIVTYAFTRRISADVNTLFRNDEYIDTFPLREDDTTRLGCGLNFRLLEWMTLRTGYTYNTVDSTLPGIGYEENRFLVRITIAPAQPYRFDY